jgi:SAM-dependent methyltransferase
MGGGQRFGLRLAEAFADMNLPTRFFSPRDSEFGREAARLGFEVVDVTYPRLIPPAFARMPDTVIRLREQFESAPPGTMVIGNTARCQAYATAALVTVRQWPVLVHLMHEQNSAARPSARAVYRRIGALVAVGDQTADLYRQRLPGVEIDAVSNFLGEAEVRRVMSTRTPSPAGERPIVGMLGRMIPEKGIIELVEELSECRDAWQELRVGAPAQDSGYQERVVARIAELGLDDRVHLLGEVGDLDAFFAGIDVLVVPSVGQEAQPTVILEGLLYGRPVVLRSPLRSSQLEGLPVAYYTTPAELDERLRNPPEGVVTPEVFLKRFGASDVVDTILRVASEELDAGPRGYFDWHDEPGYYRDIVDHFRPPDRMLDVGCGTAWLQDHFPDYVGIDLSEEAVAHAQALGRNAFVHDVEQPLPFEDDSFDAVIVKDLLEHVLDPVGVVQEIGRVLRPGGHVFASSPDAQRWVWDDYTHRRPYTLTGYRRLFRDQGFRIAKSGYESVMPGIGILSGLTRHHHRPKPLAALARLRLVRRNVWVLGRWG